MEYTKNILFLKVIHNKNIEEYIKLILIKVIINTNGILESNRRK